MDPDRNVPHRTPHRLPRAPNPAVSLAVADSVSCDQIADNLAATLHPTCFLLPDANDSWSSSVLCELTAYLGHALRAKTAGAYGPDLAKKLSQLVKMEKNVMRSLETVAKERMEVAVRHICYTLV